MGGKLGATPAFGKAGTSDYSRPEGILRSFAVTFGQAPAALPNHPAAAKSPGQSPGLFVIDTGNGQAAGL